MICTVSRKVTMLKSYKVTVVALFFIESKCGLRNKYVNKTEAEEISILAEFKSKNSMFK